MESRIIKRNVALVEKCTMSSVGIKSLFNTMPDDQYKLHLFSNQPAFSQAMLKMSFSAVIFSLSAIRTDRRAGLTYLTELAINYPRIRRVVIADDDAEARLIGSLSPLPLDGVVSKASSLTVLQDALFTALSSPGRGTKVRKTIGILIKAVCSARQNEKYCALCRMVIRCHRLLFSLNGTSKPFGHTNLM